MGRPEDSLWTGWVLQSRRGRSHLNELLGFLRHRMHSHKLRLQTGNHDRNFASDGAGLWAVSVLGGPVLTAKATADPSGFVELALPAD